MEEKLNYFDVFKEIMDEKGITIKELEDAGILAEYSFYNYKNGTPTLEYAVKIANYLKTSLDYILGNISSNSYRCYNDSQSLFYSNLENILKAMKISKNKLAKDLGFSKGTLPRWAKGTKPLFSNVVRIAKYLGCNIDDLLETEK